MHTIFYNFKVALYSRTVVMKGFNTSSKVVLSRNYYCKAEGWSSFKCVVMHLLTYYYK